jgi:hypothetical protein
MRLRVSGTDAALGAIALRDAALGVAGPSSRAVPGFGTLVALAILGGLAAPGLRRLDSGSSRRKPVLRPPGSAHISLTARRATKPDPPPP